MSHSIRDFHGACQGNSYPSPILLRQSPWCYTKRLNGASNGWRHIHDLSYPKGQSVNDGIREDYGSLLYQTIDDAIRLIKTHDQRCILRKRDLKDAFRTIPVSPLDCWLFLFE